MSEPSVVARPKSRAVVYVLVGLGGIGVLGVVALVVLRLFFFVPYRMPAGSMLPTLAPGTHLWAKPSASPPTARGEIVVFRYPEHPNQSFVKRVAGLEGDSIEMRGGRLYINGWEAPRCIVGPWAYREEIDGSEHAGELVLEHVDGASYLLFEDRDALMVGDQGPYKVASGQYFVLGDNRNNSHDSRMWFGGTGGGVPFANTIGRVRIDPNPKLPIGAEKLQAAFDDCIAKKPAQTSPPGAKP